ncbi:hypothetical protein KR018_003225, partial [Drosophila ironensis]
PRRVSIHAHSTGHVRLGAYDNPGTSIFATSYQEPIPNMLSHLRPIAKDVCDQDKDASPLKAQTSPEETSMFRLVKYQVEELAADRNKKANPKKQLEKIESDIASNLARELRGKQVAASRCLQLHRNVVDLRNLEIEVAQAKTALQIKRTIVTNEQSRAVDKKAERAKAQALRLKIEQEERDEEMAKHQKAAQLRTILMGQITEARARRLREKQANNEVGMKHLHHCHDWYDRRQEMEAEKQARMRRELLESEAKSAELLKLNRAALAKEKRMKPERGILDALGPVTAKYVEMGKNGKLGEIEARDINSARLGFQLSQIKRELEGREQLITNLLIREFQAKDNEMVLEKARKQMALKREIRDQLLSQRREQKFFREKAAQLSMPRPKDPTSFGERQYRIQEAHQENSHRLDVLAYRDIAAMIEERKHRKASDIEEARLITQFLWDQQARQDEKVAAERMKVLSEQQPEVLSTLRKAILTEDEINAFNLKK